MYRGRTVTETYAIAVGQRDALARVSGGAVARVGHRVPARLFHARRNGHPARRVHPVARLRRARSSIRSATATCCTSRSASRPDSASWAVTARSFIRRSGRSSAWAAWRRRSPLAIDHPIDAGIAKFCDTCRACRKYCPADAIPDERSPEAGKDHLGYDRYMVDTGRCFPYFAKHYYCSICLPVCVYNHKEWARDFEGFRRSSFRRSSWRIRRRRPTWPTQGGRTCLCETSSMSTGPVRHFWLAQDSSCPLTRGLRFVPSSSRLPFSSSWPLRS